MLVGYPPFFSDDPKITCQKILHWKKTLVIPPEANLSPAATDIIKRLMCEPEKRLGVNGIEEIKNHPFFEGMNWNTIRNKKAPYIPNLKTDYDCQNFDKFDEEDPFYPVEEKKAGKFKPRKYDLQFYGYTFKKDIEE